MRRKLNQVGNGTLTVSLPANWVKQHKLSSSDSVFLYERENGLHITKESIEDYDSSKRMEAAFSSDSYRYIRSYVHRLYRMGFSEVTITFDNPSGLAHVTNAIESLLGAGIVESTSKSCTIRFFPLKDINMQLDDLLVRMTLTMSEAFSTFKNDITSNSLQSRKIIDLLRNNNWKLKDFALRKIKLEERNLFTLENVVPLVHAYEKVSTIVHRFYKNHLENNKRRFKVGKDISKSFDVILKSISWIGKKVGKKKPLTIHDETYIRNELHDLQSDIYGILSMPSKQDKDLFGLLLLISEILDGSVSYLVSYKWRH